MLKLSVEEAALGAGGLGTGEGRFGYKCSDKPWLHMEWE